jgi:hypothetical protein
MTGRSGSLEQRSKLWQDSGQPMPHVLHALTLAWRFLLSFSSESRFWAAHAAVAAISADLLSLKAWESSRSGAPLAHGHLLHENSFIHSLQCVRLDPTRPTAGFHTSERVSQSYVQEDSYYDDQADEFSA